MEATAVRHAPDDVTVTFVSNIMGQDNNGAEPDYTALLVERDDLIECVIDTLLAAITLKWSNDVFISELSAMPFFSQDTR